MDLWSVGCVLISMELLLGRPLLVCRDKHSLCGAIHAVLGAFQYRTYFDKPFVTQQSSYCELHTLRYEGLDRLCRQRVERDAWSNHFVQLVASLLDLDPATRLECVECVQDDSSAYV